MRPAVFLFDVDGVLVQPGGYRAALRATLNYFTHWLGLGELAPDDTAAAIFEAHGITCEWDMAPILLAIILDHAAVDLPANTRLDSLEAARAAFLATPPRLPPIDFPTQLRRAAATGTTGEVPAEALLRAVKSGGAGALLGRLAGQPLLDRLLLDTRRLDGSPTTAVFEMYALGNHAYERFTGSPAQIQSDSLLQRYDRPSLAPDMAVRLASLRAEGQVRFSAYTARPSFPGGGCEKQLAIFAPEAEMAIEQMGIQPFPLVGSGQTGFVARRLGAHPDYLTKPSPYHALAAAAAAWTGDTQFAVAWMEQVYRAFADQPGTGPLCMVDNHILPEHLSLHIFEDSPAGMRGGRSAVELLTRLGVRAELHLWGVSEHPEKMHALASLGAQVFPDVNAALQAAFVEVI
jgi:hypothetical protein